MEEFRWGLNTPLKSFSSIDKDHFPYPWSDQQWEDLESSTGGAYRLFYTKNDQGEIIGFALFLAVAYEPRAELLKIVAINKREGDGSRVLLYSLKKLIELGVEEVLLEVSTANKAAFEFYLKHGFEKMRKYPKFYGDSKDAWTMRKALASFDNSSNFH